MRRPRFSGLALIIVLMWMAGCAKPRLVLPSGSSQPVSDAAPILDEAFAGCSDLRTIALEVGLSGRAGQQKLRGRLLAGLAAPSSIRLEAVAPFGPPVFILAASETASVLLLPRDDRVLRNAPPREILAALAGVDVLPSDLMAFLGGCPGGRPLAETARRFDDRWIVVDLDDGATAYLRRETRWRAAAVVQKRLRVVFEQWAVDHPAQVRLQNAQAEDRAAFDILLKLSQFERNSVLPAEAFTVDVPSGADPITLEELRRSGPMRDVSTSSS